MKLTTFNTNVAALLCFFLMVSCAVDRDDNLAIDPFPEIANTDDLIAESSELFSMMETVATLTEEELVCVKFIYPFTLVEYDAEGNRLDETLVQSDIQLLRVLTEIPETHYINLSFPITALLEDGTEFVVDSKEALQESLSECIGELQDIIIGGCQDFAEEPCAWVVMAADETEPFLYENSVFSDYESGQNRYYYRGEVTFSSWVFYFIEDKLHLNIALEDESELADFWNRDWEALLSTSPDGVRFVINDTDGNIYYLQQVCDEDAYCDTLIYTECELPGQPNIAEFDLESYVPCIDIITAPLPSDTEDPETDFEYSFHESMEDADTNSNAIDTSGPYQNSMNPQTLYVRKLNPETDEHSVVEITIIAETCE